MGEIDAALDGTLPAVVGVSDMRGDFHMHCTWSDGANTLEEMIVGGRRARLRLSFDLGSLVAAGDQDQVRPQRERAPRAACERARARRALRSAHALFERGRYLARRPARLRRRRAGRARHRRRQRPHGDEHLPRGDDRADHSRVRKPVRQRHRPPHGPDANSSEATSSITTRSLRLPREPGRRSRSTVIRDGSTCRGR